MTPDPEEEQRQDQAEYETAVERLATLWGHPMSAAEAGAFGFAWDRQRERLAAQAQRDAGEIKKWRDEADKYHQLLCVEIERVKAGAEEIARLRDENSELRNDIAGDEAECETSANMLVAAEQRAAALSETCTALNARVFLLERALVEAGAPVPP